MMEATLVEGKSAIEAALPCSSATRSTTPTLLRSGVEKLNVEDETMVDAVIRDESYKMRREAVNLRQLTGKKPQTTHLGKSPSLQEAPNVKLSFRDKFINSH